MTSPRTDVRIATLAARQHGLVRTSQLNSLGLTNSAIHKRVARGVLHRVHHGVYAVGHGKLSRDGQFLAAVFAAGAGAALGHFAAALLWEVRRYRTWFIDVVVPARRRVALPVRVHRCNDLSRQDVTVRNGIPVTTVARLLVDFSDYLTKWDLANVIHEAAFKQCFTLTGTRDAIARARGRRRLRVVEQAVELHLNGSAGTRSRDELKFLIANERAGLPEPLVNTHLNGFEVDFHWPDLNFAIELDGPGHDRPRTRAEDAIKTDAWSAEGYELARFKIEHLPAAIRAVAARAATAPRHRARATAAR